jgi:geranylgeranyl diphosphate synthase type 3
MEENLSYEEKLLTEPVKYYMENKGKNIRQYITTYIGHCLGVEDKYIEEAIDFITVIHNASLVIDDIQDNSLLRRKQECAHIKYGIPLSLNAGYLCIFKILNEINKKEYIDENTRHKIVENMYLAHIGQGMDIYYTQYKIIPNIESYNMMIKYKTGTFLHIILDIMIGVSKNVILKKRYYELREGLYNFSLFYQIRDDYINLTDSAYWEEKGFCQDFDEQKISYLITYCNNNKMTNYEKINNLMTKLNKTNTDKIEILNLMKNNGLFDIIYNILLQLREKILLTIDLNSLFEQLPFSKFDENVILNKNMEIEGILKNGKITKHSI